MICSSQLQMQNAEPSGRGGLRPGFSLVEMMVVIIIIGVLAAMITSAGIGALKSARDAGMKAEIDSLAIALETYKAKYGSYPPNLQDLPAVRQHIFKLFPRCKDAIPSCYGGTNASLFLRANNGLNNPLAPTAFASSAGAANSVTVWEQTAAIHGLWFWLSGFYPDPEHPLQPPKDSNVTWNFIGDAPRVSFFDFKPSKLRVTGVIYRPDPSVLLNDTNLLNRTIPLLAYYPDRLDTPYVYFSASGYDPRDPDPRFNAYSYPLLNSSTGDPTTTSAGLMTPVHVRYARVRRDVGTGASNVDDLSLLSQPYPFGSAAPDLTTSVCIPYQYPPTNPLAVASVTNKQYFVNPKSFQIICAGEDNMYTSIYTDLRTNGRPGLPYTADGVDLAHGDMLDSGGTSGSAYLDRGVIWWYPTGPVPPRGTMPITIQKKDTQEQRDNLTNFARRRLEAEVP